MDAVLSLAWFGGLPDARRSEATVTDDDTIRDAPPRDVLDVDAALVARARQGERRAFDEIVRRHQRGVWRMVRRYLRNDADASDVTQQAFVRAFRAMDRFRGEASVRSWLYRIGINLALNHVRDRARELPSDIAPDTL